jgi:adhesin/invasin
MLSIITGRRSSKNLVVWGALLAAAGIGVAGCNKVPLLAPSGSSVTLSANTIIVQANGTAEIRATVIESSGTPVQNGTTVTFSTNLGTVSPTDARTINGVAISEFTPNGQSGTAKIVATSGGAKPDATSNPLTITVGSAAAGHVQVTATPNRVASGGGTATITAVVIDTNGNPLNGIPVAFSTDFGTLSSSIVTSGSSGQAVTTLTTSKDATVTATTGTTAGTGTVKVTVGTLPDISIAAATGATLVQGQPVAFTVTVTPGTATDTFQSVAVNFGDGSASPSLGGGSTSVSHTYNSPGTFTVTATGTSSSGDMKANATIITVTPRGLVNVTIAQNPSGTVAKNTLVTFTATVTPATNIQGYDWAYGDGQFCPGCSSQVTHSYSVGGGTTYTVNVTVRTTDGNAGNGQTQIFVSP